MVLKTSFCLFFIFTALCGNAELRLLDHAPRADQRAAMAQLSNGMRLYLISDPKAPLSSMTFVLSSEAHATLETPPDLPAFTNHLLMTSFETLMQKRPLKPSFSWRIQKVANATYFFLTAEPSALPYLLDQFTDKLLHFSFTKQTLQTAFFRFHQKKCRSSHCRTYPRRRLSARRAYPGQVHQRAATTLLPQEFINWHHAHTDASTSCLILLSPLSLQELYTMAAAFFTPLPQRTPPFKNTPLPSLSEETPGQLTTLFTTTAYPSSLEIRWQLPYSKHACTADLLTLLLTSKHSGSLYDRLKTKGWIEHIETHSNRLSQKRWEFSVDFTLSSEGLSHPHALIATFYQALRHIKTHQISHFVFDERQAMAKLAALYPPSQDPFIELESLATRLSFDFPTLLQETAPPPCFDAQANAHFLDQLTPKSAIYTLTRPPSQISSSAEALFLEEGLSYTVEKIDDDEMHTWEHGHATQRFTFPQKNPFIPCQLTLVNTPQFLPSQEPSLPFLLTSSHGSMHLIKDPAYRIPKIDWTIYIKSSLLDGSPKQTALGRLFSYALTSSCAETLSYARAAGLTANFSLTDPWTFALHIEGYSDQATTLLHLLTSALNSSSFSPDHFERARRDLAAALTHSPLPLLPELLYTDATYIYPALDRAALLLTENLIASYPSTEQQQDALLALESEDLSYFAAHCFDQTHIQALLAGNLTQDHAHTIWAHLKTHLSPIPYPKESHASLAFTPLLANAKPLKLTELVRSPDQTGLLVLRYRAQTPTRAHAFSRVLELLFNEDLAQQLGNDQKSAHLTRVVFLRSHLDLCAVFSVQSRVLDPDELIARLDLFLENYLKNFDSLIPKERFDDLKRRALQEKAAPDSRLTQVALLEELQSLSYDDLKHLFTSFLSRANPHRLALAFKGTANTPTSPPYHLLTAEDLRSILET